MKIYEGIVLLVFLSMLFTGIGLISHRSNDSSYVIYSGDITFDTVGEYVSFKEYLIASDVIIRDIEVLESGTLAWARYNVKVPRNLEFPFAYDYMDIPKTSKNAGGVVATIGLAGIVSTIVWIFSRDEKLVGNT